MLGTNTDTKAQENNNNAAKGEMSVIEKNNNEQLLSVQQIKEELKENYQETIKKIVEYILCDNNKKKFKHDLIAAFLESCQEKDLTIIIFDIVKEIVSQLTAATNNNNIQIQSYHVLYSFFETSFLFIDQQHRNIISYLSSLEKKVIKFRSLYLLLFQLNKVFKDFCLQNISQSVLIHYIAISAYYGVVEDESLAKKMLINNLSVHEKQNRDFFDDTIKKINEFQIIDLKFIAIKLQLITAFIEHSLLNKHSLFIKDLKKWLREDDLLKIEPATQTKEKLSEVYKNAITIHHFCRSRKDNKAKINSPIVERRVKSEETLPQKTIASTKSKLPSLSSISSPVSFFLGSSKSPLDEFIGKLRSVFTIPIFSINDGRLKEFWNIENNIEDRIRIAMELFNCHDQELVNNLLEYLSIILRRPFNQLNERLFTWLRRIKELGFDYQPYYSEYITNTFVEIEKLNLLRIMNHSEIEISTGTIIALQNAREIWYVEGNEKYISLLKQLLLQMQIEIPANEDVYNEILYLTKIEKSDCFRIKRQHLQQVFDENKVAKMEPERFVLEFLLITFKKIEENYKSDHNLTAEEIEKDFFVIYWDDLSFECQIRLIDYINKIKLYPPRSSTVRKVNNRLLKLIRDKKVEFKRSLLTALYNESEFKLAKYYDKNKLDISSNERTEYQLTQFFYDTEEKKLVPTTVHLQQVFLNRYNQLVWLKIINDKLVIAPVDTSEHTSHKKKRFCLFDIDLNGRLFVLSHNKQFKKQAVGHSAIGDPFIIGSGEASIEDILIFLLTFYTGHYWDFAEACERIVSYLIQYYAVSNNCLVYMRNAEKIAQARDNSNTSEDLRNLEQSLSANHSLTLHEFKNSVKDPVGKLQKGISRCIEVFTFFFNVILDDKTFIQIADEITDERIYLNDIRFSKTKTKKELIAIKVKLQELIHELKTLKINNEREIIDHIESILGKYDFRPDKNNFFIDYLYKTLKDARRNIGYLDFVVYRPQNLISQNNLISILYDYLSFLINELKAKLLHTPTMEDNVDKLIQKNEFGEVYQYFLEKLKNHNDPQLINLLTEVEINPLVTFHKNESVKVQAFRIALCSSLFKFKQSSSEKGDMQEFNKLLELQKKSEIKIKDFIITTHTLLSARGETSIRSYLNTCLKPVKTFIGLDVIVTDGTDILARLIDEFSYDSSLAQEEPVTLSTSPVSAPTLG